MSKHERIIERLKQGIQTLEKNNDASDIRVANLRREILSEETAQNQRRVQIREHQAAIEALGGDSGSV